MMDVGTTKKRLIGISWNFLMESTDGMNGVMNTLSDGKDAVLFESDHRRL